NVHKRYLIHVAGFNLGILMRALFGHGTPREAAGAKSRAHNRFSFKVRMKRSATPLPWGSRTKDGEASNSRPSLGPKAG
ncbi:MAG: hypothetical protein ACXWVS_13020, partial [Hyphomicrobium sp.]